MPITPSAHVDRFVIDSLPSQEDWPELTLDIAAYQYAEVMNAASELLDKPAASWPDRPCMSLGDTTWTYSELAVWANRLAHVLVDDFKVVPGNRVLLRGPNTPWMVAAWFAILKVGCVAVSTMPLLRESELKKIYQKCSPAVAFCATELRDALEVVASSPVAYWGGDGGLIELCERKPSVFSNVDTRADDPALLGFTSGTTGQPKATVHFHRDLLTIADQFLPLLKPNIDDVFTGTPPLAFTFGLGGLVVFPMRVGACTVFCETPSPAALAQHICDKSVSVCFTAPTAFKAMLELDEKPDLSSLRRAVSAGETLPESTFIDFEKTTGVRIIDGFGSTEMLHIFLSAADDDIRPGATGKPLHGYQARIIDENGCEVPDGEVGRLAVKGPIGCRYLGDDRQKVYVQDGWNVTGDAFVRDGDGYFYFKARIDDMIISSGYNIAAPEVEEALMGHPAVSEVGVIGVPDEKRGSLVTAFVYLHDPTQACADLESELKTFVKETIAPYKYPRSIIFSDKPLPKTPTGKLQRKALKDL